LTRVVCPDPRPAIGCHIESLGAWRLDSSSSPDLKELASLFQFLLKLALHAFGVILKRLSFCFYFRRPSLMFYTHPFSTAAFCLNDIPWIFSTPRRSFASLNCGIESSVPSKSVATSSSVEYMPLEDVEKLERYRPGGFHPITIGDRLHDWYHVVHKAWLWSLLNHLVRKGSES
jgi:hypothetical protein